MAADEKKNTVAVAALARVVGYTGLSTVLTLTVVSTLSNINTKAFEPCEQGCVFIRYFAGADLPATRHQNLPSAKNVTKHIDVIPHFMWVQNGHPMENAAFSNSWFSTLILNQGFMLAMIYSVWPVNFIFGLSLFEKKLWIESWFWNLEEEKLPRLPETQCANMTPEHVRDHCASNNMKAHIENHLSLESHSPALICFIVSIVVMGFLKIYHDAQLMHQKPTDNEAALLAVNNYSYIAMCWAFFFGFFWFVGVVEVFLAVDPEGKCNCYYTYPPKETLVAGISPISLFVHTYVGYASRLLALQHGDYLSFKEYRLPQRFVRAIHTQDPTKSLMISSFPEGSGGDRFDGKDGKDNCESTLAPHNLTWSDMRDLARQLRLAKNVLLFVVNVFVGPLLLGAVFVRLFRFANAATETLSILVKWGFLIPLLCAVPFVAAWKWKESNQTTGNKNQSFIQRHGKCLTYITTYFIDLPCILYPFRLLWILLISTPASNQEACYQAWDLLISAFYANLLLQYLAQIFLCFDADCAQSMRLLEAGGFFSGHWTAVAKANHEWHLGLLAERMNDQKVDPSELQELEKSEEPHQKAMGEYLEKWKSSREGAGASEPLLA